MHGGGERVNGYAARQNGRGVWLYNQLLATASQISSLQRRTPFFADSSLTLGSAVETPQAARLGPCSDQLALDHPLQPSCVEPKSLTKREKFTSLSQMPRRHFKMCRSPLQADDTHAECVSCLGKSQADAALSGTDCSHCEIFSLASLHSRIAFFSESNCAPRTSPPPPPLFSYQGPVRKGQWAEDLSSRWQASSHRLNVHVPHHHRRESIRLSSLPSTIQGSRFFYSSHTQLYRI